MSSQKPDWWDDLEDGTRDDARVSQETERKYVRADGKRYWFDVKEVTWKKKNEFVSDCLKIGEDETDLKLDQYYLDILEYMIEDMSIEGDNVKMFLIGVNAELGEKLQDIAPKPGDSLNDREEGNSDEPFEELEEESK